MQVEQRIFHYVKKLINLIFLQKTSQNKFKFAFAKQAHAVPIEITCMVCARLFKS